MTLTCPKCHGAMRTYERSGVTVDQCGECRGIFLDRGELEKLVDAENAWHGRSTQPAPSHQAPPYQTQPSYPPGQYGQPYRRKRKSFLDELFD
jgi:Zn-finger nucleic acid-binding protein